MSTIDVFAHWEHDFGAIICDGHRRCTQTAIYIVKIHAIHSCKSSPRLDPNGDNIYFMCQACTAAAMWRIGEIIGEMYSEIPDDIEDDAEIACAGCEHRILEPHDIISVERLLANGRMHQM